MTGAPPSELMAMSAPVFAAYADEAEAAAWTPMHEMAAFGVESLHGIYRLLIGALTKSNPPEQVRIRRPGDPGKQRVVIGAVEMARRMAARRKAVTRGD